MKKIEESLKKIEENWKKVGRTLEENRTNLVFFLLLFLESGKKIGIKWEENWKKVGRKLGES